MRFERPTPHMEDMTSKSKPEQENFLQISDAKDFGDLFDAVRTSTRVKDPDATINLIRSVISGKLDFSHISSSEIREKVHELLQNEQENKEASKRVSELMRLDIVEASGSRVTVSVRRSTGEIEDGWLLVRAMPNGGFGAIKTGPNGKIFTRTVFPEQVVDAENNGQA